MSDKLKSRKLWVFIAISLLVIANYLFHMYIPADALQYLVALAASYIIGQGYVDGKNVKTQTFPVDDFTGAVTNIIQAEIQKTGFGNNLPMEQILDLVKGIMKQELGKVTLSVTDQAQQDSQSI